MESFGYQNPLMGIERAQVLVDTGSTLNRRRVATTSKARTVP
jgi:hypothetical protein